MINKYLKPILDWASGLAPRVLILILTFGALAGLIWKQMDSPWMISAVVISGIVAQVMNYLVQKDKPTGDR